MTIAPSKTKIDQIPRKETYMKIKYTIVLSLAVALLVCVFAFYVYGQVLESPQISMFDANVSVSDGKIYDFLQKIEREELTLEWTTDGEIVALADGEMLFTISYDLNSLDNAIDLVNRLAVPESYRWIADDLNFLLTPLRMQVKAANSFFYNVVPLKFSLSVNTG